MVVVVQLACGWWPVHWDTCGASRTPKTGQGCADPGGFDCAADIHPSYYRSGDVGVKRKKHEISMD